MKNKKKKEKTVKMKIMTRRFKNFKAGDDDWYIEVYPKTKKHERSDIDIFRMVSNSYGVGCKEKIKHELDMTPDEALHLAGNLITASMFWLINYKPYWDTFMKKKRDLEKSGKKK